MSSSYKRRLKYYLLLILPALCIYLFAEILPIIQTVGYSFLKWNLMTNRKSFIGLENYIKMFSDSAFWESFGVNLKLGIWTIVGSNILGFIIAYFLNEKLFLRGVIRTMFFIPNVISTVLIAFIWVFIYSQVFPAIGKSVGWEWLASASWFGTKHMAMITIITVSIWQSIGFLMLIYTAGLQTISRDILEAGEMDGCTGLSKVFRIQLPLLMPSITINLFVSIASSFKAYDIANALTGGGPSGSTQPMSMNIYQEAFVKYNLGYGSAKSVFLFLVVAVITLIQLYLTSRREVEA